MNKTNIPKLRFKEFSGEWEEKRLGDYGKLINGLTYSPNDITDNGLLVLRSSNIQNRQLSFLDNVYVNLEVKNEYLTKQNDILICVRNGSKRLIGKNVLINKNLEKSTHGAFMTLFRGDFNQFISHWFQTSIFYKNVHKNLGATINSINGSDLKKFKIIFPNGKQEQKKIASFLTTVDKKIEQLTKKVELQEQYKKSVMGKIFKQEIRFKNDDGSEFEEWEEKKLKELAIRSTTKNKDSSINNVLTNSATFGIVNQTDYFDKDIANQNNLEGYYVVKTNDFIYNPRISNHAPVGPMKRNKLSVGIMSPLYTVFRFKKINLDFIEYYFNSPLWHKYMYHIANYGARHDRMNITNNDFLKMPINIPQKQEQTKIANFLSSLDKKIDSTKEQLAKTKEFKKGLLQNMFV